VIDPLLHLIGRAGAWEPWILLILFLDASALILWRLEAMSGKGVEGTVLGTLIMPYCTGIGNLIFVAVMVRHPGTGDEVMVNCLVNNATNLTLLIGLPTIFWGMTVLLKGKAKKKEIQEQQVNRLSLSLTIAAAVFFTGCVWALSLDGKLGRGDGIALIGLFLFWQCMQVVEGMKLNVIRDQSLPERLWLDFLLLILGGFVMYVSVEGLVTWLAGIETGFIRAENIGWLSGWLLVLPNAVMAMYYGWKRKSDIVYSSQVGDGHICIPLCLGVFAVFEDMTIPESFSSGIAVVLVAAAIHLACVSLTGRLTKPMGGVLVAAYLVFLYIGLIQ
jgi:cation:H+ antiporter